MHIFYHRGGTGSLVVWGEQDAGWDLTPAFSGSLSSQISYNCVFESV